MMPIVRAMHTTILNQLHNKPAYQTVSPAKCLIAGAHAVLRGHPALAVPLTKRALTLQYWQTTQPVTYALDGPGIKPERLPLADFFDYVCHHVPEVATALTGHFYLEFNAGIANGLGTSASLAMAFAQWCAWRQVIKTHNIFKYAHCFEHFFHGTSSGVDVAAIFYQQPLIYRIDQAPILFKTCWTPLIYLSSTGKISNTKNAIDKVAKSNELRADNGLRLDLQMAHCVQLIQQSLSTSPPHGFKLLHQAFDLGYDCYQSWGLNEASSVQKHYNTLRRLGATAIKPTGAGDGGYVLSLWTQAPVDPPFDMIAVFP